MSHPSPKRSIAMILVLVLSFTLFQGSEHLVLGKSGSSNFTNSFPINYERPSYTITAEITKYTTSPDETDETPTLTASGYVIKRGDFISACPASLPFWILIKVDNIYYRCADRMAYRFRMGAYFDLLSPNKQDAFQFGRQSKQVTIYP